MMTQILLSPTTKKQINGVLKLMPHAVLILGPNGSGKPGIAGHIVSKILNIDAQKIHSLSNFLRILPENGSITIEEIRKLQNFTKLKTSGIEKIRRFALIEDAQCLGIEAQNAFLKLLEEPPEDTMLILTCSDKRALLPTILSRVQIINSQPIDSEVLRKHFIGKHYSGEEVNRAITFSQGLVGLTSEILSDKEDIYQKNIITAKKLVSSSAHERLIMLNQIVEDKENLAGVMFSMKRIYQNMLKTSVSNGDKAKALRYSNAIERIMKAQNYITKNVQVKIILDDLFLNL